MINATRAVPISLAMKDHSLCARSLTGLWCQFQGMNLITATAFTPHLGELVGGRDFAGGRSAGLLLQGRPGLLAEAARDLLHDVADRILHGCVVRGQRGCLRGSLVCLAGNHPGLIGCRGGRGRSCLQAAGLRAADKRLRRDTCTHFRNRTFKFENLKHPIF